MLSSLILGFSREFWNKGQAHTHIENGANNYQNTEDPLDPSDIHNYNFAPTL